MRLLLVVALLTGCTEANRFSGADTCDELFAAFEATPVSDNAAERREVGDEYRERLRQLGCEI